MNFERCSTSSRFCEQLPCDLQPKENLKIQKRMPTLVDSCRKCTKSSSFLFWSWHLLSLKSCKGCNPMCLEREEAREMVGNQLSCLHFLVILLDEQQECWLPVICAQCRSWLEIDLVSWKNKKNEAFGKGLCPKQQIHGTPKFSNFWEASKYHYLTFLNSTQQRLFCNGNAR
jgi:hypothetical protein